MRKRPSARLLVLNPEGRLLLLHFVHMSGPLAGKAFWATPGGSLAPGESFPEAARRELLEETGIEAQIGGEIGFRSVEFMMPSGEMVAAEERYFLLRSTGAVDHGKNPDPIERDIIAAAKWWSLDEIRLTDEIVYPETIADMVEAALVDRSA